MEIVDTHTHIVSQDLSRYPITPGVAEEQGWHREHPVDADQLLVIAAASGVTGVAFVQAISCHGFDNRYVLDSAARSPGRTIAVGSLRPDEPGAVEALRRDATERGMHGVRLFAIGGPTTPLDSESVRTVVAAAADLGLPIVLLAVSSELPSLPPLVRDFPSARFVLDHCGFADLGSDDSFVSAADLFALTEFGNVVCKVSSITLRSTPHPSAFWRTMVARFGADRLMWGTDFPHTNEGGYAALVELGRTTSAVLSTADQAQVLAGTARRTWPAFAS